MTLKSEMEEIEKQIAALKEREAALYRASLEAPPEEKICEDWCAEMLASQVERTKTAPYVVERCVWDPAGPSAMDGYAGREPKLVKVRVAGEKETHFGILFGELPTGVRSTYNTQTRVLHLRLGFENPAIFVPKLKRIVMGCESWWAPVKSEDDVREITDGMIHDAFKTIFGVLGAPSTTAAQ